MNTANTDGDDRKRRRLPGASTASSAVEVHNLGPRLDEVAHESFACVIGGIGLGYGTQLGVRAEDEIDRAVHLSAVIHSRCERMNSESTFSAPTTPHDAFRSVLPRADVGK